MSDTRGRGQVRIRTKVLLGCAGAIVFALAIVGLKLFSTSSTVKTRLARLSSAGEPVSGAELNAYYAVPAGVADTTTVWSRLIDLVDRGSARSWETFTEKRQPIPSPGTEWKQLEDARSYVQAYQVELDDAWAAARVGGQVRFPVDFSAGIETLLPHTQQARLVARLLVLDAHVSSHDGDHARALRDINAMLALSDALEGEPCAVSQLVRVAIRHMAVQAIERLLPHAVWSDEDIARLQHNLMAGDFRRGFHNALVGERAICLTALNTMPLGPLRGENENEVLDLFEETLAVIRDAPWHEVLATTRSVDDRMVTLNDGMVSQFRYSGILLLAPNLEQIVQAAARAEARRRTAFVALWMHRRLHETGQVPRSWDTDFLKSTPQDVRTLVDPFDGKPLRMKREADHLVLYSVGVDRKDDGGQLENRTLRPGPDVGFRLQFAGRAENTEGAGGESPSAQ